MSDQTEASAPAEPPQLVGIGGWLVLPAIGFILGPIVGVVMLVIAMGMYSEVAAAGYGGLYALELLVEAGLMVFMIYTATRFYGKKRNAPATIITLMIVSLASSVVLLVVEISAGAETFILETVKQLVRGGISAAIWIPYFRVSQRVKATFVN